MKLVVGTRGSLLARTQTAWVVARLQEIHPGLEVETRFIVTTGDRISEGPLAAAGGGKGLFVKEIEDEMLAGGIDFAVHSLKDLPAGLPEGLVLGAVPAREDPRDAWVSATCDGPAGLRPGAVVGTTSLRRGAQVRALRPDVTVVPFRGNIDTRLRKAREGQVDATMLAVAGLKRAGFEAGARSLMDVDVMVPAAGQAALAIECRAGDGRVRAVLAGFDHAPSRREVAAERRVVARLGGSCNAPIGALARADSTGWRMTLTAVVLTPDGGRRLHARRTAEVADEAAADALGDAVFEELRRQGAVELLASLPPIIANAAPTVPPLPGR